MRHGWGMPLLHRGDLQTSCALTLSLILDHFIDQKPQPGAAMSIGFERVWGGTSHCGALLRRWRVLTAWTWFQVQNDALRVRIWPEPRKFNINHGTMYTLCLLVLAVCCCKATSKHCHTYKVHAGLVSLYSAPGRGLRCMPQHSSRAVQTAQKKSAIATNWPDGMASALQGLS